MAQWRNIFFAVAKGIGKWPLGTLLLAWSFFISEQAPVTVAAGAISTYIIFRCCGHVFVAIDQLPRENEISPSIMAQWMNIDSLVGRWITRWLQTLLLAWSFFLSKQASPTVAAVIATHVISHCCGCLSIAVNQAPEEFSFSDPHELRLFTRQLPRIENQIRFSTERAMNIGIITTFFPRAIMAKLALCYTVCFCAGLYYLLSVGPESEGHGGPNGGNNSPPHDPKKVTEAKGKPKKKNKEK